VRDPGAQLERGPGDAGAQQLGGLIGRRRPSKIILDGRSIQVAPRGGRDGIFLSDRGWS
jgi:hypothetical protein